MQKIFDDIEKHVAQAVSHYWLARKAQRDKQKRSGVSDAGLRSAVTGGAQMDGFITLFRDFVTAHGSTALIAQPRKFF
ncbi:MAG: PaeR7I family type II restriction endonuclease [Pseudomonadota bacterium]